MQKKNNQKWKKFILKYAKTAISFEIHCWNEEKEWIDLALKYGKIEFTDWSYGKVIHGLVTEEFIDMLIQLPKPIDTEIYNKMTPFFSIFFDNDVSSEHYGTELIRGSRHH